MLKGGCQCGAVRYECDGEPMALYVCHCLECRHQSASAFGMSLSMPAGTIRVTQGTPHFWTRLANSGRRVRCAFCPGCGSRLWHEPETGAYLTIKAGSLDDPVDISKAIHIWTSRKLPGFVIPPAQSNIRKSRRNRPAGRGEKQYTAIAHFRLIADSSPISP